MPKRDRLLNEQEHHRKAFEVYAGMGGQRSTDRVAQQLGVSASAVKLWSRSFHWQQRLREREAAAARQVADQTLRSSVDELARNRKIVQMALVRLAKAIAGGQIKLQLSDLDRMIRLSAFLDGYAEDAGWGQTPAEIARQLDEFFTKMSTGEQDAVIREMERLQAQRVAGTAAVSPGPGTHPPEIEPPSPLLGAA